MLLETVADCDADRDLVLVPLLDGVTVIVTAAMAIRLLLLEKVQRRGAAIARKQARVTIALRSTNDVILGLPSTRNGPAVAILTYQLEINT
jgi:hypothetical protein